LITVTATQNIILEGMERIEKKLEDMASIDVPMSKATHYFYKPLLDELMITVEVIKGNEETGGGVLQGYEWGEREIEADGQPGCKDIIEREILPLTYGSEDIGLFDARGLALPQVQAGKRKSKGFSDLAVSPVQSWNIASTNAIELALVYTIALIELKTAKAEQKLGQLVLQLVSLALVSRAKQGVVVLGTDCKNKWMLLHFSGFNKIIVQPYAHGKKCLAEFKNLIMAGAARTETNIAPPRLPFISEEDDNDQSLQGFDLRETNVDEAIDRENKLRRLAIALGSIYGETPEVPFWARASETCPSYYM
jgi:hypothetical protein